MFKLHPEERTITVIWKGSSGGFCTIVTFAKLSQEDVFPTVLFDLENSVGQEISCLSVMVVSRRLSWKNLENAEKFSASLARREVSIAKEAAKFG